MSVAWAEARKLCAATGSARRTAAVNMALRHAAGHTLAEPLHALGDLPGFASSAMDGWVTAGTGPWQLGHTIRTGDAPSKVQLASGWARAICTGAPVPSGPVVVVRAEHGVVSHERLALRPGVEAKAEGADIRPRGEEARTGDLLLPAGSRLTPAALALAAVAGVDSVTVRQPPRVRLALLGSEIVDAGVPAPGQVRDAYGIQLPYLLQHHGADVGDVVRVADDLDATTAAFARPGAQLIISTGGSSHGATDYVRLALAALGAEIIIDEVAMRPGHPVLLAALADGTLVLCLPGSPLAAMIALITLGLPLIDGMLGRLGAAPRFAPAGQDFVNASPVDVRILACRMDGGGMRAVPYQGSGMLRGLAMADCLAVVPPGGVHAGEAVRSILLPW